MLSCPEKLCRTLMLTLRQHSCLKTASTYVWFSTSFRVKRFGGLWDLSWGPVRRWWEFNSFRFFSQHPTKELIIAVESRQLLSSSGVHCPTPTWPVHLYKVGWQSPVSYCLALTMSNLFITQCKLALWVGGFAKTQEDFGNVHHTESLRKKWIGHYDGDHSKWNQNENNKSFFT